MIKNRADKLYVGISQNPQQRLAAHNKHRGAKFTKRISEYQIVFLEQYQTLSDAWRREIQIKKWRRDKKNMLIDRYRNGLPTKR
jgi:putative endonuclease